MPRRDARRSGSSVSIPVNVPDDELDSYITEMILSEARAKELAYERRGIAGYEQRNPTARTNKRFLASMIRSVDSHNQRQEQNEAQAAQRLSQSRFESEQKQSEQQRRVLEQQIASKRRAPSHSGARTLFERSIPKELRALRSNHRRGQSPDHTYSQSSFASSSETGLDCNRPSHTERRSRWDQRPASPALNTMPFQSRSARHDSTEPEVGPEPAPPVRNWDLGKDCLL